MINPGGIRANLLAGEVTYAEAFTTQPFGNTMATVVLTGDLVDLMLEQQWKLPTADHPVLRLGLSHNVEYVYDPTAPAGERVSDIFIGGELVESGDSYTVAGNAFLLKGGDGFSAFTSGTLYADTGIIDLDSLINYFRMYSPIDVDYTQGSTGLALTVEGDTVTAAISSLSFTNDEPKPATAFLEVNGVLVGSDDVDSSIDLVLDDNEELVSVRDDETGKAMISFPTPDGFDPATAEVRIYTDDLSTNITF